MGGPLTGGPEKSLWSPHREGREEHSPGHRDQVLEDWNCRPVKIPEILRRLIHWLWKTTFLPEHATIPATIGLCIPLKLKRIHEKLSLFLTWLFTESCLSEIISVHAISALREFAHENCEHTDVIMWFMRGNNFDTQQKKTINDNSTQPIRRWRKTRNDAQHMFSRFVTSRNQRAKHEGHSTRSICVCVRACANVTSSNPHDVATCQKWVKNLYLQGGAHMPSMFHALFAPLFLTLSHIL